MTKYLVVPLDKMQVSPYKISPVLKRQLQYFTDGERRDTDKPEEFFFPLARTSELLREGVFYVVSPLDDQNQAEIEITDEQEDLLEWLVSHQIERVQVSAL